MRIGCVRSRLRGSVFRARVFGPGLLNIMTLANKGAKGKKRSVKKKSKEKGEKN